MNDEVKACCDVWRAVPRLPEDASDEVKDDPDACVADVVAATTAKIEGEDEEVVGSKPAIFVSIRCWFDGPIIETAHEFRIFSRLETQDIEGR